ncbi:MAG: DUF4847 family protein [Bacteroidaceae bacterium]|jgi:hypothetical protein|nr:DUF4847 family protein [Bacteroidaceae bacterium]
MKKILNTVGKSFVLLVVVLTMTTCNTTDDINAIFRGHTWNLTYIKEPDIERFPKDKQYSISFKNDNFEANMPNGATIKGKWHADGSKNRTFSCTQMRVEGNIADDVIASSIYNILINAKNYDGDTNWLHIIKDKNTYMQFYN